MTSKAFIANLLALASMPRILDDDEQYDALQETLHSAHVDAYWEDRYEREWEEEQNDWE